METGLTIHCMVRNEPFVYYAVKSVYEFADVILLYDTGSYDEHTLKDIQLLLQEDVAKKIIFKEIPIEVDETKWSDGAGPFNYRKMAIENRGKKGKWYCRQLQITDTTTSHFMILDGDEVHYKTGMEAIIKCMNDWPSGKICGFVPLVWFKNMGHTFHMSRSGRLFLTNEVNISSRSPGEIHTVKRTGKRIGPGSVYSFSVPDMVAYAHWETMLKPWRRNVPAEKVSEFKGSLPEVMVDNTFFVERFIRENLST